MREGLSCVLIQGETGREGVLEERLREALSSQVTKQIVEIEGKKMV